MQQNKDAPFPNEHETAFLVNKKTIDRIISRTFEFKFDSVRGNDPSSDTSKLLLIEKPARSTSCGLRRSPCWT